MSSTDQTLIDTLRAILLKGQMGTQEEIGQALEQQGFSVNQSKISRLIHKLGAVKTTSDRGQISYHLPREPAPPPSKSRLGSLVIGIEHNETTIVIRTVPGGAAMIARLLDYNAEKIGSLGSVAGDDTIMLAPMKVSAIKSTVSNIKQLLADM